MLKSYQNHKRRHFVSALYASSAALMTGLLLAFTVEAAWAQTAASHYPALNKPLQTDAATAMTLPQAIALALDGNLDLTVAKREVEARQAQVLQGRARPNPEFAYALEDQNAATRTHSLQINLPIEMGGKRAARVAAAESGRELAIEELNMRRVEIRAAVVAAFFETLAAQEVAALAQDSVDLAKRATDAAAKRVAAGKASPVEETKARVAEAGVRVERSQAQSAQRSARARLASLLGAKPSPFTVVAGSVDTLPTIPSFDTLQQRLSSSPMLRRAQLEIAQRRSLVKVERSKRTPDITFSLGVKRPHELQRNQLLLGLSVPLPLLDRNQGNLQEALTREDKARDELQALQARVSSDLWQARERLEALQGEVDALRREVLPGAKSAYDAATIGFENGKFSFLEVLDAQRSYFAAKSQYFKALAEAHRTAADIERVLGEAAPSAIPTANKK